MEDEKIKIFHLGNFSGFYDRKTRTFTKIRKEKDIIRKYNGIAIPSTILEKVRKLGCNDVQVLLTMNNGETKVYRTTLERWFNHGIIFYHGLDYQRILTLSQLQGGKEDLSNINFGKKTLSKREATEESIISEMKHNIALTKGAVYYRSNKEEQKKLKAVAYTIPLRAF